MTLLSEFMVIEIEKLLTENMMMRKISTIPGFVEIFNEHCKVYGADGAFLSLNFTYKNLFGKPKFKDYADFIDKTQGNKNVNKLARAYLMEWFKSKGFDTWLSFYPLVLHYFPEVTKSALLDFYEDKLYTAETLKKVEYVKQIIGE